MLCSRNLDVLRAQRIMGFFILITHKSTRSQNRVTWTLITAHTRTRWSKTAAPSCLLCRTLAVQPTVFWGRVGTASVSVFNAISTCYATFAKRCPFCESTVHYMVKSKFSVQKFVSTIKRLGRDGPLKFMSSLPCFCLHLKKRPSKLLSITNTK